VSRAALYVGDALEVLRTLPDESVQCCVTSPPYWGLRDYGVEGQLGLEHTPQEYVEKLVAMLREVLRVLRDDGTLWLVLGDSYATGGGAVGRCLGGGEQGERFLRQGHTNTQPNRMPLPGLKPKDLVGIPWRVAFALQADGWYLRSDIIWSKPNPMPESVTDRPTKAHEYVFLFSKSQRYFYDADAVAEETAMDDKRGKQRIGYKGRGADKSRNDGEADFFGQGATRNARTVWDIATRPYSGAHFATMPSELASRCIKAGSKSMDTILDPFGGSGTTAAVATGLGRKAIHIDLDPDLSLAIERIGPLLVDVAS